VIERLLAAESALARDELDAAERQFHLVAEADPRNAIAVVGLARLAARRGDPGAARTLAHRALEIDPDEAAAARLLAELEREAPPAPAPAITDARPWWRRWLDRLRGRG
jgi:Flp pilus assembly protein TadD